jgi:exodeoxyribonuclease VII small subunit
MAVKKKNSPTFEESLDSLKKIVSELEQGKLTLGESLERYESGVRSLRECYDQLQEAQRKIEKLVKIDENGNLITEPFDDQGSHPGANLAAGNPSGGNPSGGYRSSKDTVQTEGAGADKPATGRATGRGAGETKSEGGKSSLF